MRRFRENCDRVALQFFFFYRDIGSILVEEREIPKKKTEILIDQFQGEAKT